ncbi:hypothetical protein HB364_28635 [Pseudoflavitalea sp. X16]|uniref:hypothetical protein n=1 Tax=Paraflavitalea devenefica TaxID=2716334 RepID=UPI00141E6208|nr:hypothetical protein [Paraflavitalea devenefica]NII29080.1 hypothetical protein [Paraflavitalea devenefica]
MLRIACRAAIAIIVSLTVFIQVVQSQWPDVPAIDLSKFKPSDFTDDELDMPYYLKHFHTFANGVIETGPDKGFINIAVWRSPDGNKPYNARIMENILSLAYFYCTNRPWNIYYGSSALRPRLEAALSFWCRIQHTDGRFSEYGPQQWNLPATAFSTKFMGEALRLLKAGPPIDPVILQNAIDADRKAIMAVLTMEDLYKHGKNYSNQYTNVWAGALAYLSLYPDAEISSRLAARIKQSAADFQSPAGFFYEAGGTDFGYNFNTHHSNLWMAYHYSRGTPLANAFTEEEKRYYSWISYNAVPEPGSINYTINRAIEMRQKATTTGSYFTASPLGEAVAGIGAFNMSSAEKGKAFAEARKSLEQNWPHVQPLSTGAFSAFSPYAFLHRAHYQWYPSPQQKEAAVRNLPYIKSNRFIHQKMDSRHPTVFTYVRQPGYYASFNSGPLLKPQQRYGIGLLWHPEAGSFLQSQTDTDDAAWGTKPEGGRLYEADTLDALFLINNKAIHPTPGGHDLKTGMLAVSYKLGATGKKSIVFRDKAIEVAIQHPGPFKEYIPLLLNSTDSALISSPGKVTLRKPGGTIYVLYDAAAKAVLKETTLKSGLQRVVVLCIESSDQLGYSFDIH